MSPAQEYTFNTLHRLANRSFLFMVKKKLRILVLPLAYEFVFSSILSALIVKLIFILKLL